MLKEENKKTATGQNDEACYTFQGVWQNFKLMGFKEKINENFIILKIIEFILAFSPNDGFENPFHKIVGFRRTYGKHPKNAPNKGSIAYAANVRSS